ncbi:hypothetical protein GXW82_09895 [Streptacidiphilus sp. 4-A2]|nr:hypothetical protein [Streptacidiphilus sp. 4-A2]
MPQDTPRYDIHVLPAALTVLTRPTRSRGSAGGEPCLRSASATIDSELSDASFRGYCRKLTAGVAVVTACGDTGWTGTTVSTVTSVSMEPPILLTCFASTSRTLSAIRTARRFAVHLLADEQWIWPTGSAAGQRRHPLRGTRLRRPAEPRHAGHRRGAGGRLVRSALRGGDRRPLRGVRTALRGPGRQRPPTGLARKQLPGAGRPARPGRLDQVTAVPAPDRGWMPTDDHH